MVLQSLRSSATRLVARIARTIWLLCSFGRLARFAFATVLLMTSSLLGGWANAQTMMYVTSYPYDGNNLPLDLTKQVYANTMAELCAQRTEAEILEGQGPTIPAHLIFVGLLPDGNCGYQTLNFNAAPRTSRCALL